MGGGGPGHVGVFFVLGHFFHVFWVLLFVFVGFFIDFEWILGRFWEGLGRFWEGFNEIFRFRIFIENRDFVKI